MLRRQFLKALPLLAVAPMAFLRHDHKAPALIADGVTDNSEAMRQLLKTAPEGATIRIPAGTYRFRETIDFSNRQAKIRLIGDPWCRTRFVSDADLILRADRPCGVYMEHFAFEGNGTCAAIG